MIRVSAVSEEFVVLPRLTVSAPRSPSLPSPPRSMDSEQLLKETQRAIGTSELYNQHQRLIQLTEEIKTNAETQKNKRQAADQLQRQQDQLRRDVERFAQQERLLNQ